MLCCLWWNIRSLKSERKRNTERLLLRREIREQEKWISASEILHRNSCFQQKHTHSFSNLISPSWFMVYLNSISLFIEFI